MFCNRKREPWTCVVLLVWRTATPTSPKLRIPGATCTYFFTTKGTSQECARGFK